MIACRLSAEESVSPPALSRCAQHTAWLLAWLLAERPVCRSTALSLASLSVPHVSYARVMFSSLPEPESERGSTSRSVSSSTQGRAKRGAVLLSAAGGPARVSRGRSPTAVGVVLDAELQGLVHLKLLVAKVDADIGRLGRRNVFEAARRVGWAVGGAGR